MSIIALCASVAFLLAGIFLLFAGYQKWHELLGTAVILGSSVAIFVSIGLVAGM